ncbi:thermonuclease family protein [Rhodoferax sp.]|jgi:micrococcal nuclease|uniref:thermonuclease family protein n=1 Tax=Rhodoferax sp. TaxID=50421 RepID=UPI0025E119DF|nr:thermonuclease family protein [Rhodoferax sp.]
MKPVIRRTTQRLWRYGLCVMLGISQCVDALSASAVRFTARATAVPDGDTLWVQPANGGRPRKLRLLGIDAPEVCQQGGEDARRALQQLVDDVQLQVDVRHTDDYGRGLARIHADGRDIAAVMVQRGHAWSSRWRRSAGPYAVQERMARSAGLGLFAHPAPENPRDFRQRHGSCYPPK